MTDLNIGRAREMLRELDGEQRPTGTVGLALCDEVERLRAARAAEFRRLFPGEEDTGG